MVKRRIVHKSKLPFKTRMRLRAAVLKVLRRNSKKVKTARGEALTSRGLV